MLKRVGEPCERVALRVPCRPLYRPHWQSGALALIVGAVATLLLPPGTAQAQVSQCTLDPKPNTLLSLAKCCAADLKSNPTCEYYSATDQFVIVKDNDPRKPDAYLIIPSVPVTGIEDTKIFLPPFVNFWNYGWNEAQRYIKQSSNNTGLAINSVHGRDQNQLHIHISCVSSSVAKALADNDGQIGSDPTKAFQLSLGHGNPYEVIKVKALTDQSSPFALVAKIPGAGGHMADQSIAVIGSKTAGVYYVLDTYAHSSNPGAAEELLNQTCK